MTTEFGKIKLIVHSDVIANWSLKLLSVSDYIFFFSNIFLMSARLAAFQNFIFIETFLVLKFLI